MKKGELMEYVRAMGSGNHIVKVLEIRTIGESVVAEIGEYIGIDTFDVCFVIECLRHYDSIESEMEQAGIPIEGE